MIYLRMKNGQLSSLSRNKRQKSISLRIGKLILMERLFVNSRICKVKDGQILGHETISVFASILQDENDASTKECKCGNQLKNENWPSFNFQYSEKLNSYLLFCHLGFFCSVQLNYVV